MRMPRSETAINVATMPEAARAELETALRAGAAAGDPRAYSSLGQMLLHHRPREAAHVLRSAVEIAPNDAHASLLHGTVTQALSQHEHIPATQAAASFSRALRLAPRALGAEETATVYSNLGIALMSADRPAEAQSAYDAALALQPTHAAAYRSLAALHTSLGDAAAAERVARAGLRQRPTDTSLFRVLSRAHEWGSEPATEAAWVETMERVAAGGGGGDDEQAAQFSLFHALRAAEPTRAWEHLARGNSLKARHVRFDAAAAEAKLARLRTAFSSRPDQGEVGGSASGGGGGGARPIFIVGFPRSGSTVLQAALGRFLPNMSITSPRAPFLIWQAALAQHSDVFSAGET